MLVAPVTVMATESRELMRPRGCTNVVFQPRFGPFHSAPGGWWAYLAGVLLLVDDSQGILRGLSLGLGQRAFHLGTLRGDEFMGFALRIRHGFL